MKRKRRGFRKNKRPKDDSLGLSVKVYNNNVDEALRRFKRNLMLSASRILQTLIER